MQINHFIIQSTRRNIAYDYVNLLTFRQSMNWKFSYHTIRSTSGHKTEDDHSLVKHFKVNFLITCFKKEITETYTELQVRKN